jgi:hypothetical protein
MPLFCHDLKPSLCWRSLTAMSVTRGRPLTKHTEAEPSQNVTNDTNQSLPLKRPRPRVHGLVRRQAVPDHVPTKWPMLWPTTLRDLQNVAGKPGWMCSAIHSAGRHECRNPANTRTQGSASGAIRRIHSRASRRQCKHANTEIPCSSRI